MSNWKYTDSSRINAHRVTEYGGYESCLVSVLPEGTVIGVPDPEPPKVHTCSKRQGELALLELPSPAEGHPSMLHWVESAIVSEEDPIRQRKMQAYFNASEWKSDDEFVATMWAAAGKMPEELITLFEHAATL